MSVTNKHHMLQWYMIGSLPPLHIKNPPRHVEQNPIFQECIILIFNESFNWWPISIALPSSHKGFILRSLDILEESTCPKLLLSYSKTLKNSSLRKQDSFVTNFGSVEKWLLHPINFLLWCSMVSIKSWNIHTINLRSWKLQKINLEEKRLL